MPQTALAKLIDTALTRRGEERRQLALHLNVTPVSVSRWLRPEGDTPIPWKHFPKIAVYLKIPMKSILAAAQQDWPDHVNEYRSFVRDYDEL